MNQNTIPLILGLIALILSIIALAGLTFACDDPQTSTDNGSVYKPPLNITIIDLGGNECPPPNDTGITCGPIPEDPKTVGMQPTR